MDSIKTSIVDNRDSLSGLSEKSPPHVIRVLFGDHLAPRTRRELKRCVAMDRSGVWDKFGGAANVSYFVCGESNYHLLRRRGWDQNSIFLADPRPLIQPEGFSVWYNKTWLILKAFEHFGMSSEVLYLDLDVDILKPPDSRMASLLRRKAREGANHVLSPVRFYPRTEYPVLRRVPLVVDDDQQTNPYNCFVYCDDGASIVEILQCYHEMMGKYGPRHENFEGCDEVATMYWYDRKMGARPIEDIVNAFEPISVIRVKKFSRRRGGQQLIPTHSLALKNPDDIYFFHQ